jgi:hypothetical protein
VSSYADNQLLLAIHRKQHDKGNAPGAMDYSLCGPPHWDRNAWEAYKQQYGHYPYGHDGQGGWLMPTLLFDAPDWVYELIGQRPPPIRPKRP